MAGLGSLVCEITVVCMKKHVKDTMTLEGLEDMGYQLWTAAARM